MLCHQNAYQVSKGEWKYPYEEKKRKNRDFIFSLFLPFLWFVLLDCEGKDYFFTGVLKDFKVLCSTHKLMILLFFFFNFETTVNPDLYRIISLRPHAVSEVCRAYVFRKKNSSRTWCCWIFKDSVQVSVLAKVEFSRIWTSRVSLYFSKKTELWDFEEKGKLERAEEGRKIVVHAYIVVLGVWWTTEDGN